MKSKQCDERRQASGSAEPGSLTPADYGLTRAMYDVNETLRTLSIGRTTLYQLVKEKELTPAKFGKKTLFAAPDIAALLNRRRGASLVQEAA